MQANIGILDRVIRIVSGVGLLALMGFGFIGLWGWLGLIALATGLFSFCPAYRLLGISSCSIANKHTTRS